MVFSIAFVFPVIPRVSGACCGPPHRCKKLSPSAAVGIAQHLAIGIGFLYGFYTFPTGAKGRAQGSEGAEGPGRNEVEL